MHYVFNISILFWLCISLTKNQVIDKCEEIGESYNGCEVFKIEPNEVCLKYLETNEGFENLIFYLKPFTVGEISMSLHQRSSPSLSTEIIKDLYTISVTEKDIDAWYKIKIVKKDQERKHIYTVEANEKPTWKYKEAFVAVNEIRVKLTVTTLWSSTCDPREPNPTVNIQESSSHHFLLWFLLVGLLAAVIIIIIIVMLVLIHKRRNRAPDQVHLTDNQFRLSQNDYSTTGTLNTRDSVTLSDLSEHSEHAYENISHSHSSIKQ